MKYYLIIILLFLIFAITSCSHKEFSDDKFIFSNKYMSIFNPYKIGDSLTFENVNHQQEVFIITKKDSTIQNSKGWFMNQRSYKNVSIHYNQIPSRQWKHEVIKRDGNNRAIETTFEDDRLFLLNIYPDKNVQSCWISFKRFRGEITDSINPDTLNPIIANGQWIENYYKVDNYAYDLIENDSDVKTIYIINDKGIVAYQDQNSNWWTRIK